MHPDIMLRSKNNDIRNLLLFSRHFLILINQEPVISILEDIENIASRDLP